MPEMSDFTPKAPNPEPANVFTALSRPSKPLFNALNGLELAKIVKDQISKALEISPDLTISNAFPRFFYSFRLRLAVYPHSRGEIIVQAGDEFLLAPAKIPAERLDEALRATFGPGVWDKMSKQDRETYAETVHSVIDRLKSPLTEAIPIEVSYQTGEAYVDQPDEFRESVAAGLEQAQVTRADQPLAEVAVGAAGVDGDDEDDEDDEDDSFGDD